MGLPNGLHGVGAAVNKYTPRDPHFEFICSGCTWDRKHCGGGAIDIGKGKAKGEYKCACHRCACMATRED